MFAPRLRLSALSMALLGAAVLSGCAALDFDPTAERERNLKRDLSVLEGAAGEVLPERALEFKEVLEIALRNNFELRVAEHELEIASRERLASRLEMLPRLDAEAAATRRSDPEVKAVLGPDGRPSGQSSLSEPQQSRTADLTLTWSVLDFMTAAIRSEQRELQAAQLEYRRQKIRQRIALEVTTAFWRAAAAEDALEYSYNVKRQMERQYERLTASMRDRSVSLLAGKEAQLKLIELSIAIQKLHGNLSTARLELVQLMGLKQNVAISLQRPDLRAVISTLPRPSDLDIKQLEFVALRHHPILFENDLQAKILQEDTRAAMISLFPGLSLFAGRHYDDSALLSTNTWNAIGAELSWNLFALPAKFQRLGARELAEQRGDVERALVTASVITQVHLGLLDYAIKADRFLLMDDSYKITQDIEGMTDVLRTAGQVTDMQYTERLLENLATKLRRDEAVVELFASYAKLFASIGLTPESWQGNLADIGAALSQTSVQPDSAPGGDATPASEPVAATGAVAEAVPVASEAPIVLASVAPQPALAQAAMPADAIAGSHLWDLQVGAFQKAEAPSVVLEQIRGLALRMLDTRDATVKPVTHAGQVLQQVRFHHLPQEQARDLCADLRAKGIDCWVTRSERG